MTTELLDGLEKKLDKVESAIRKHTQALNLHDMSRRHPVSEDRNKLAGDVYETRQALDSILSTAKQDIQDARKCMRTDAQKAIISVAKLAENISAMAGVGGVEMAGQIISCLYANPELVDNLMAGNLDMIDDDRMRFQNGVLSWHAANGDVVYPSELRAYLGQRDN